MLSALLESLEMMNSLLHIVFVATIFPQHFPELYCTALSGCGLFSIMLFFIFKWSWREKKIDCESSDGYLGFVAENLELFGRIRDIFWLLYILFYGHLSFTYSDRRGVSLLTFSQTKHTPFLLLRLLNIVLWLQTLDYSLITSISPLQLALQLWVHVDVCLFHVSLWANVIVTPCPLVRW